MIKRVWVLYKYKLEHSFHFPVEALNMQPTACSRAKPKEDQKGDCVKRLIQGIFQFFFLQYSFPGKIVELVGMILKCILPMTRKDLCRDDQNLPHHTSFICALF